MFRSFYIHVPYCRAKCDYCAFYSEPGSCIETRRPYIARLIEEMVSGATLCSPLESIFVGGGTPSLLSVDEWQEIGTAIRANFTFAPSCEWTMEANPDSLTRELIACWASLGVNRISLGIQAFQPELRTTIGRRGSLERLDEVVAAIRQSGIHRLNFDLIFNIPGQTIGQWHDTLTHALSYHPTHLSAYALTLEEGTRLASTLPTLDDDDFLTFWNETDTVLATAGIRRYEISNFSLPGEQCRHNDAIWHGGTYLGCGPAAASFDGSLRWTNPSSIAQWLAHKPPEKDLLPPEERAAEILALGFRTIVGWNWDTFTRTTGFDAIALRGTALQKLEKLGLVSINDNGATPTQKGLLFNDDLAMELI